jgi:hypothetical protein
MTGTVTVDTANGQIGGAARYAAELHNYLARTGRKNVQVIGEQRRVNTAWLLRREIASLSVTRRVALNNVSFVTRDSERSALLANALHGQHRSNYCFVMHRLPRANTVLRRACGTMPICSIHIYTVRFSSFRGFLFFFQVFLFPGSNARIVGVTAYAR